MVNLAGRVSGAFHLYKVGRRLPVRTQRVYNCEIEVRAF
jgi:hypothetical protein